MRAACVAGMITGPAVACVSGAIGIGCCCIGAGWSPLELAPDEVAKPSLSVQAEAVLELAPDDDAEPMASAHAEAHSIADLDGGGGGGN